MIFLSTIPPDFEDLRRKNAYATFTTKKSKGLDLIEEGYCFGCQSQMSRGVRSFVACEDRTPSESKKGYYQWRAKGVPGSRRTGNLRFILTA
jgi:cbb3-type cytochrome oxidase cytochrome c subunit